MVVMPKKVKTFEVMFSDPSKAYYIGGDKVAGRIVVEVSEMTKVSAMKVFGVGCARVEYAKGKQRCREEVEYLKYEEIVHLDNHPTDGTRVVIGGRMGKGTGHVLAQSAVRSAIADTITDVSMCGAVQNVRSTLYLAGWKGTFCLVSQKHTDGSVTLRPGCRYEYIFGYELPQHGQLVSSYKGKFGYVQYFVKAVMERPSQPALECKKSFEVEEPLDVNTPDLLSPTGGMKEKKVTCMFIPDGQVSLNAKIDRKGFCEGEDICINAKFENTCSRIVVPKAAIIAKHIYQANGRTKVFCQKFSPVRGNHIISGMCDVWQGKTIRVPKINPSILGCNIIRVEYALRIYVHIPGSDKLILELPLVIGTIPYNGFGSRTSSVSSQESSTASNSWVSLGMPSAPPSYSDIAHDCRLDTPLLDDYDGSNSPIFMHHPEFQFPPPPAYSEIDKDYNGSAPMLQVC